MVPPIGAVKFIMPLLQTVDIAGKDAGIAGITLTIVEPLYIQVVVPDV